MIPRRLICALVAATLLGLITGPAAVAGPRPGPPAPLLASPTPGTDIASSYGSGVFGHWFQDGFGLPAYDYTIDQQTNPAAKQPELNGSTEAWSQVGNDHVVADAFNDGYVQLWSQDRLYQWMNAYDAQLDHFSGGFGYLNVGGHVVSTLYDDRPLGAQTSRVFGVGYYAKSTQVAGLDESDVVYAPFGNDPILLHDVTITNTGPSTENGSYFEYWDVNPEIQSPVRVARGYSSPVYDPKTETLSVKELPDGNDTRPLSIFASALNAPVSGFDTNIADFFGVTGSRAMPAAVAANHARDSIAPPAANGEVGQAMFAFQSPFTVAPHSTVTLRYAYGYGHSAQVESLVAHYRAVSHPLSRSEHQWRDWLPQTSFGSSYDWLSRELQWDAYTVRSDATYDAMCGYHILSQGGYYQYYFGQNEAFRDPLQIMLPMIAADPTLARQVIEYSAHEQPQVTGTVPYGIVGGCQRFDLGVSDDMDQWLLWGTAEYVLQTRDFAFLDRKVPYFDDTGSATMLQHLELAFEHQEQVVGHGPHGEYLSETNGDWNDFSAEFLQMTESALVTAQAAYVYPELAQAVARVGATSFASQLRAAAAKDLAVIKGQFVTDPSQHSYGWFARGYSGTTQIGAGEMFEEPQPWAILDGASDPKQSAQVVAAFRRFLEGIGAPRSVGGPSLIGASMTPSRTDPGITESSSPAVNNSAGWPGGTWYDLNGWMVWAMSRLDGVVPGASADAWYEFVHNTLAAHAVAFPDHWDGVISVDDECASFYSPTPANCGIGLTTAYNTQIPNQAAYSLFDVLRLAGISADQSGYQVVPHMPMETFSVSFPNVGVAQRSGMLDGYLRPVEGGQVSMSVALPPGIAPNHVVAWVDGKAVPCNVSSGLVHFVMPTNSGTVTNWAVT